MEELNTRIKVEELSDCERLIDSFCNGVTVLHIRKSFWLASFYRLGADLVVFEIESLQSPRCYYGALLKEERLKFAFRPKFYKTHISVTRENAELTNKLNKLRETLK